MTKKRILSGMRPTGPLHIGHLLGALNNWVDLQEKYSCFFMIADWHALMSEYENPQNIQKNITECAIDWLSCGIDHKKSVIFTQSRVPQHLELAMIFSDITPLSWLERCPTYKEQLREQKTRDLATYGFLGYPVLQAADIALYKAQIVPVGEDQMAHLELTREIIRRFKHLYKDDLFPEPEGLLTKTPRILGLDNRKMSKTFDNFIALSDPPDVIKKKVSVMITDPARMKLTDSGHPDICNVYSYCKIFKPQITSDLYKECIAATIGCTDDKRRLADIIIAHLELIQKKRKKFAADKKQIQDILDEGAKKAQDVASDTMKRVRKLVGLG
ncbi:MAG: tryptophan--tRNA ligase [Candidatus Omnitrophica bacterium CG_4_8_14_3_um_filter_43_15]|nr:MAG: tryptophan--tRNA ligase [Candidatus Omnitrophica bacterium CG1_02_43_210]PIV12581.1 MAG: tryptophan--tRNA ligase [Candidatus Omnitrophica bacterium CG03_land_8_20_14_0_80_43_22]PIW79987.1 MAG: tryptophan--tRNA ligase [Candidatus Omnitrophica bacterium CG_4_8_14_3_um_filter_43_15]PIY84151.1 MAG: tryptophan--tRNA ligase [Candidatus Omnitrophica bacterium CG_4_10_14_0_8_um_filter_43_18]PJC46827.1 MAG: tryptophan--tRNA ligase [Candidatus Omnitrophica bacterium CG_4_9_14_0_2_um_filter_43_12]